MAKITKAIIAEYFKINGASGAFDEFKIFNELDKSDWSVLELINDKLENSMIYTQRYDKDVLAVNVKTDIGNREPFPAIPNFIKEEIPDIQEYIENYHLTTMAYQDNYEVWESDIKFAECDVVGKSGGYWAMSNFDLGYIFKASDDKKVTSGLRNYLEDKLLGQEEDSKEDIFYEIEHALDELNDYPDFNNLKELIDLGVIEFDKKAIQEVQMKIDEAKSLVDYYEYMPNIVKEVLLENEDNLSSELYKKYEDYVYEEEAKMLDIKFDQTISFDFKSSNRRIITVELNTEFDNPQVKFKVSGRDYEPEAHKDVKINGKLISDILKVNLNGVSKIDALREIKSLIDFNSIVEQAKDLTPQKTRLFSVQGIAKPQSIDFEIFASSIAKLNKDNLLVQKNQVFIKDNTKGIEFEILDSNSIIKDFKMAVVGESNSIEIMKGEKHIDNLNRFMNRSNNVVSISSVERDINAFIKDVNERGGAGIISEKWRVEKPVSIVKPYTHKMEEDLGL